MNDKQYPLTQDECRRLLGHCWPWGTAVGISGQIANRTCQHCGYTERYVQPAAYWEPANDPT